MQALLPFRGGLRRHLVLLVLGALVPMLLWAGGLVWWNSFHERQTIERGLGETARALTIAVDQEIELTMEGLASAGLLSLLPAGTNDYRTFDHVLRVLVGRHPGWAFAGLIDREGRQVLNTLRPFGTPLPSIADYGDHDFAQVFRQVMTSGRPAVSNLVVGKVARIPLVVVAVPMTAGDGAVSHVVIAGLLPERLAELLLRQQGPPGWVAAVIDRRGVLVARSLQHNHLVGQRVPEWWRTATAGRSQGVASGRSMHGPVFTFAFQRSRLTGWLVVFGAPRQVFTSGLSDSLVVTAGFGVLVVSGSILLALAMARRILAPVQALTIAARPFIPPERARERQYQITELDDLHHALDGLAEKLSQSRQRFQKVFSVAPVMLFVCDAECQLAEVNETWLRTMGYRRDEVLGRTVFDFHTADSRDHCLRVVRPHFLRTGAVDDMPAQYVTKGGEVRDVLLSLRGEHDAAGKVVLTIGAVRDVTDQRRTETALNRAVEDAARANAAKSRFLAAASHDLRQPLQALALYLGVLRTRLGDREAPVMGAIGQCVDSLSALLNDMLDIARLDSGAVTPRIAEVPVSRLLERVAAAWTIQAEAKGVRLRFVPCGATVRTDPALMDRVLSNLVGNAVRYTEHGRVLVGCRRAGDGRLRIEVWDTGIGIPEHKLGEIFEEFRQLGNAERRRDRGTGLGLAIVQRICDLLGHDLAVRSWPGRGSVFSVTLATAAGQSRPLSQAEAPMAADGRRILVVDDEAHVRTALQLVLSELGHQVATADTVESALDSLDHARPQLVIADFRLGGGHTGIEVVDAVRRRMNESVPAVVLTGDTDPNTLNRIVGAGIHLLHKPLQVEALKTFLHHVA